MRNFSMKSILVFGLCICLFGCDSELIITDVTQPPGKIPDEPSEFIEFYICEGPNDNGLPLRKRSVFFSNEIDSIFGCGYIDTSDSTVIVEYWSMEDNGTFAFGDTQEIYFQDRFVFFSLRDAIDNTLISLNYLNEYTSKGNLPVGMYEVSVYEWRNFRVSEKFYIVDR